MFEVGDFVEVHHHWSARKPAMNLGFVTDKRDPHYADTITITYLVPRKSSTSGGPIVSIEKDAPYVGVFLASRRDPPAPAPVPPSEIITQGKPDV